MPELSDVEREKNVNVGLRCAFHNDGIVHQATNHTSLRSTSQQFSIRVCFERYQFHALQREVFHE